MSPAADQPRLTPKLRFPEFKNSKGWQEVPIGSHLMMRDERQTPTVQAPLYSLTIEEGITTKSERYNREFLVKDAGSKKYKLVKPKDIVYNPSNLRWGAINYNRLEHSVVVSPIYEVLYIKDPSETFLEFIAYAIMRDDQIRRFITKGQGTLVERIAVKINDFVETCFPIPFSIQEQIKIAACLTSLDNLIDAESQKLDALKAHKKGLLQNLFPREGETRPRLRFPEFRDAGEWTVKPMDKVYSFKGNNSFSRNQLNYESGTFRNIHYGDIHTQFSTLFDITREKVPYINPSEALVGFRSENQCIEGDMVFADASEDLEDIGKSIELICLNNERVVAGQHTILARPNVDILVIGFGAYLFKSKRVRTQIQKESQGAKVLGISAKRIATVELPIPGCKAEQHRIASCLSSLDDQISAQTDRIEALKTHKKGLMQQLFPAPTEPIL